jgi:hypothetical protein
LQNKILKQNFSKNFNFKAEDNVPADKLSEKNMKKIFFLHPESYRRKESDPELDPDPDPHQDVTDPQHSYTVNKLIPGL